MEQPSEQPQPQGSAATASVGGQAALWEDFVDIFFAPASVFARRARGNVFVPILFVSIVVGVLVYVNLGVLESVFDGEFNRGMAQTMRRNPRITPEMMEGMRATAMRIGSALGLIVVPILIVMTGSVLWLIGKLFEAKQTYRAAVIVAAYSYVPRILEAVLNGVQGLVLDPAQLNGHSRLTLGPGRFLDPDVASPILVALLARVDLFTIWVTVLLAIGLSVTGGISRSRAAMAAALVWIAGAIPSLLQALRAM